MNKVGNLARNIIIIGSSTGGTRVLDTLFTELPCLNASVIVVQHIPFIHDKLLAERLNRISPMQVSLAEDGSVLENARVYCAPADFHLTLQQNVRIKLVAGDKVNFCIPSIDITMRSLTKSNDGKIIGVVLTGMGKDGADGISHIKKLGGFTIAQDEESSTIYGMPKAAFETGKVDFVLHKNNISDKLIRIVGKI